MIHLDQLTVTYHDAPRPTLRDVNVHIEEGELCLVVGGTGVGKSTLLGVVNGLVPHFTGGHLEGRVEVGGRDTRRHPPRELADLVGVVGQDPLAGFVTDRVEDELAYGMELLAVDPLAMRKRVEEVLDLLGIADLRNRSLRSLSGGQQQRVAIGSVLTSLPRVLVLDEPTSALDPTAAEDVLAAVTRLVHDLGVTVVMAEHRLERAVQYADRILHLPGDGTVRDGPPAEVLATSDIAPPVVHLGRLADWQPLLLSIRDARRRAGPLRSALAGVERRPTRSSPFGSDRVMIRDLTVRHGSITAVEGVDLTLRRGEITALMGRNGSGKSSMLWAIQGTGPRARGRIEIDGMNRDDMVVDRATVGLVPQTPSELLYLHTVHEELAAADTESKAVPGTASRLLDRILPDVDRTSHPRDLSEGQKLALVLAVQLTPDPTVLLLDEPTRGLDYRAKARLGRVLRELADEGRTVVVATHDVELVAELADRVLLMAEGELVADGPTAAVIAASPTFAPQVARILAPSTWLTVDEVRVGLSTAERS